MKIKNHRLYEDDEQPVPYVASPNRGDKLDAPEYLVVHFTAGANAEGSVQWLSSSQSRASAHLVIARDGQITQLVPFDRSAWHAGRSQWGARIGLNRYSIGIELDNVGKLQRQGPHWVAWFGRAVPEEDVVLATHQHESALSGWQAYTEIQLQRSLEAATALVEKYAIQDILGHDDIAPRRKVDPGPAFPMAQFRAKVLGRSEDEQHTLYRTTANLNIRSGPGTGYDKLPGSPLPKDTRVFILEVSGSWRYVDVLEDIQGEMDLQGWVHGRYLIENGQRDVS